MKGLNIIEYNYPIKNNYTTPTVWLTWLNLPK